MKKIQAAILVIFLLFQNVLGMTAFAEDAGWTISYHGTFSEESTRNNYFAEISETYQFEGDKTLYVKCLAGSKNEANYIEVKNVLKSSISAGEYTLKYYAKKSGISSEPEIVIGNMTISGTDMNPQNTTAPSGDSGWKEYQITFTYDGETTDSVNLRFYEKIQYYAVDNISLTAANSTVNLIADSGFEEWYVETPEVAYDTEPYQPKAMMLSQANGSLILNWRNPSTTELKDVKIYDVTGGEEKLLTDTISATPSEVVYHKIDKLSNGAYYQYKIVFSYDTKSDYVYFLGGTPSGTSVVTAGAWTLTKIAMGSAGYCPAKFVLDDTVAHTGTTSMKLVSNVNPSISSMSSNIYLRFDQKIDMEEGKTYKIIFWMKGQNIQRGVSAHMSWKYFNGQGASIPNSIGTYDWVRKEYEYSFDTNNTLVIIMDGLCEAVWFDGFECYEINESKEIVSENLIKDGDFEGLKVAEAAGSITELSSDAEIGALNLEWKVPEENYSGANLYIKKFDQYEWRGTLAADVTSINIDNLDEGRDYTYKIVPVNADGTEGVGTEITSTTLFNDYVLKTPVLTKDTEIVEELSDAGNYVLTVAAKNNMLEDGLKYDVLAALYDSSNTLIKLYSVQDIVAKKSVKAPEDKSSITVTVPENDCSLEVYVVDSRNNWELYYEPVIY